MKDAFRESRYRRWDARGAPGTIERWLLEKPLAAVGVAGLFGGLAPLIFAAIGRPVTAVAIVGAIAGGILWQYLLHSDQLQASRSLYEDSRQDRPRQADDSN